MAFAVQPAIDHIALAIEVPGQPVPAGRRGAIRLAIESTVDAITLLVETMFDAITAIVRGTMTIAAIAVVGQCITAECQQESCK